MRYSNHDLLGLARTGFREIGYRDELLFSNYQFADFLAPGGHEVREITLAGFAQQPPSYRTAGFGVLLSTNGASHIGDYTALGAPHVFVLDESRGLIQRWRLLSKRDPRLIEEIEPASLVDAIHASRDELSPEGILRAKSLGFYGRSEQVDFFDLGFFPVMEQEVHRKLDQLFGRTVEVAIASQRNRYARDLSETDYRGLFRLIFRLVAAKLLADRRYPGNWAPVNVNQAIYAVEQFYFKSTETEKLFLDEEVKQAVWDEIRSGLHLQNLSLEALAYVYENTFVSSETRDAYDTHATPPEVAEFMVRQLPFELLDTQDRRVFEPFAGHAPFLTASLSRLRGLLPADVGVAERHGYLVRMLSGIEIDSFAREVARYSLILADYPNPNGWKVEEGNAFTSPMFNEYLQSSNIVLCNPPFGDFSAEERAKYLNLRSKNRAVEALLRVLERPPAMLGFLIPKSFADGNLYRSARRHLAEAYADISITSLPDSAFRHSQVDTVILLASSPGGTHRRWHRASISHADYGQFWQTGNPTWEFVEHPDRVDSDQLWREPVPAKVARHVQGLRTLKDIAEIHRGIEYKTPIKEHVSLEMRDDYARGIVNVSDALEPYTVCGTKYLDMTPEAMLYKAYLLPWNQVKVITNAARITRGPWRVVAAVDDEGLVCYQRLHGIWPTQDVPCEVIAAVLNGPVANVLLSVGKSRDNRIQDLGEIPIPLLTHDEEASIVRLVRAYRVALQRRHLGPSELSELMVSIDVRILSSYNLPPDVLSDVFDYIGSVERPRTGSNFLDQLRLRYAKLVDKKFLGSLSPDEAHELGHISGFLDAAETSVYRQVRAVLDQAKTDIGLLLGPRP